MPEAELVFLHGERTLDLPQPGASREGGRDAYARWRRDSWARFWLDELELGIHAASRNWLQGFWAALMTYIPHFSVAISRHFVGAGVQLW